MATLTGFNAANHEEATERQSFEVIPEGDYVAIIQDSTVKDCRNAAAGKYLEITMEILDGEFKGRKIWHKLSLWFTDLTAGHTSMRESAEKELGNICRAVGIITPNDSGELHGKPISIKLICKKGKDDVIRNEVSLFGPVHVAAPPTQTTSAPTSTPAWK